MSERVAPRSLVTVLTTALAAIMAVGCSLATDATPRDLDVETLPGRLQPEAITTTTAPVEPSVDAVNLTVYLLDSDDPLLELRVREVSDTSPATMLSELRRTTEDDDSRGLRTLILDEYTLVGPAEISGATITFPLSEEFYALEGQARALASAQIVFTATATAGVDEVLFVDIDGVAQIIPDGDLGVSEEPRPMTRADFVRFDPLGQPDE